MDIFWCPAYANALEVKREVALVKEIQPKVVSRTTTVLSMIKWYEAGARFPSW